jgi:hypothetical protein
MENFRAKVGPEVLVILGDNSHKQHYTKIKELTTERYRTVRARGLSELTILPQTDAEIRYHLGQLCAQRRAYVPQYVPVARAPVAQAPAPSATHDQFPLLSVSTAPRTNLPGPRPQNARPTAPTPTLAPRAPQTQVVHQRAPQTQLVSGTPVMNTQETEEQKAAAQRAQIAILFAKICGPSSK